MCNHRPTAQDRGAGASPVGCVVMCFYILQRQRVGDRGGGAMGQGGGKAEVGKDVFKRTR